jgi:hypothetical protein
MPTRAEKQAAEQAEKVAEVGLYEATEGDGNSIAVSDDGYVGVSPEYKNYANESDKPLRSEDEDVAALEQLQIEHDQDMTKVADDPTHPSEAINPTHPTVVAVEAAADDAAMRERLGAAPAGESGGSPGIAGGSTEE